MSEVSDMIQDEQGNWHKVKALTEFSLRIERASYDKATNERRWRAVASDTDEDSRSDNMSLQLFNDFLRRIQANELAPEEFRSNFWTGGMPYLSISHYPDLDGVGVPGVVDATYIDGNYLKAKGRFDDTPLGRKCFEAVCAELYGDKSDGEHDKVRISIGFLDWGHQHKSNGFIFERKSIDEICPQCLKEMLTGEGEGIIFLLGQLVHYALTRVPVNKRTLMEVDKSMAEIKTRKDDAASIVGEELAKELEEKSTLVSKSEILVTRSEEEEMEDKPQGKKKKDGEDEEEDDMEEKACAKKEEKSEVVQEPSSPETGGVTILEPLVSVDTEVIASVVRSVLAENKPEPIAHPLDAAFSIFRSAFDGINKTEGTEEDKMHLIQDPFNMLGKSIVEVIKASVKKEEAVHQPEPTDMVSAISSAIAQAMNPIAQKLDLLSTQLSQASSESRIPARRSIAPASVIMPEAQVQKSITPKLRAVIDKTIG